MLSAMTCEDVSEQEAIRRAVRLTVDDAEYRAALNEISCCDDIPLDCSLAESIGHLQTDREYWRGLALDKTPTR